MAYINKYLYEKFKNLNKQKIDEVVDTYKDNNDKITETLNVFETLRINNNEYEINLVKGKSYREIRILNDVLQQFFEQVGEFNISYDLIKNLSIKNTNKEITNKALNSEKLSLEEKIILFNNLYFEQEQALINIISIQNPEKKLELYNKYLEKEKLKSEEKFFEEIERAKLYSLLKQMEDDENENERKARLNREKNAQNKKLLDLSTGKKKDSMYNKELDKIFDDDQISRKKQDMLKYAYYKKGIDVDELHKKLGYEFYNCSADKLENYIELWDQYQRNYISRDDFYYGKKEVFQGDISQEAIKETLIPALKEDILSHEQLDDCMDSSINRDSEFFSEVVKLAETAKERGYSEEEIETLIENAENQEISKVQEEIDLLKGKDVDIVDVSKLKELSDDEIDYLYHKTDNVMKFEHKEDAMYIANEANISVDDDFELDLFSQKNIK